MTAINLHDHRDSGRAAPTSSPGGAPCGAWSSGAAPWSAPVVLFFIAVAIFAPLIAPYDPIATSWSAVRKPPSCAHWFGTDEIGRDVLSRVIYGARASLLAGVVSVCISLVCGVPIGLVSGYVGGFLDGLLMRITDALLACPVPHPGDRARGLSRAEPDQRDDRHRHLGDAGLHPPHPRPGAQRQGRGLCRGGARRRQPASAASCCATSCPTSCAPIMVQATLAIAAAIIAEASLSFLGLGQQPPAPSWGSMLNTAKNFLTPGALDGDLAGRRDLLRRPRLQPVRRRAARRARSRGTAARAGRSTRRASAFRRAPRRAGGAPARRR